MLVLTTLTLFFVLTSVILLVIVLRKSGNGDGGALLTRLEAFERAQERGERVLREEMAAGREEQNRVSRELRQELQETVRALGDSVAKRLMDVGALQKSQLDTFSEGLNQFAKSSGERLDGVRAETAAGARQLREEVVATLKAMADSNERKLEAIRGTVEGKLQALQADNAKQLEQMRQTVDEKLQGTLEKRLGESFKLVGEQLEKVHQGLGEMQNLATGVGDLKKVLTNVKTRGGWGEVQLGALLEQVLSRDQYETNVAIKGGSERVEYAVKMPGSGGDERVWLPIDAKFPLEDYQRLVEAQEKGDLEGVETAGKQLEKRVKECAQDISDKYISPPATTHFGILFLPTEGLFAEVLRRPGLADSIQHECRVVIAGPTTLWSILNSLQMGFRTLTIQKRSAEVWNLLSAVKTEWGKFGEALQKVQDKLDQASKSIESVNVRSRAVERRLRKVQELPDGQSSPLLAALDDEESAGEA